MLVSPFEAVTKQSTVRAAEPCPLYDCPPPSPHTLHPTSLYHALRPCWLATEQLNSETSTEKETRSLSSQLITVLSVLVESCALYSPASHQVDPSISVSHSSLQLCSGQVSSVDTLSVRSGSNHPPSLTRLLVDHMAVRRCSLDSGQVGELSVELCSSSVFTIRDCTADWATADTVPLLTILARPVQARPTALQLSGVKRSLLQHFKITSEIWISLYLMYRSRHVSSYSITNV